MTVSGVLIAGMFIALLVVLRRMKQNKRKTPETENLTSMNKDLERGAGPRRFSYTDLATATKNFSNERKLGHAGFGAVYRGYLADLDTVVAVKKISSGSRQGRKEYITEVKTISSLRHRNLVQLIGWCHTAMTEDNSYLSTSSCQTVALMLTSLAVALMLTSLARVGLLCPGL